MGWGWLCWVRRDGCAAAGASVQREVGRLRSLAGAEPSRESECAHARRRINATPPRCTVAAEARDADDMRLHEGNAYIRCGEVAGTSSYWREV